VLGTLRGAARRRFESLLPAHPVLRRAVSAWQDRLAPLTLSLPPVAPPARVWQRIESRLFAPAAAEKNLGWRSLGLWRALSGFATAAALGLLVMATAPKPPQAPVLVVLAQNPAVAQPASFVVSVSADGKALVLKPLQDLQLSPERTLELWALPGEGNPRSLGLVQSVGTTTLLRAQLLNNTAAFAVSIEPTGGSPTGAPTGPIVSVGKLSV
jgi:anti-sigma-K factor RskA